jgi:hypothetical protein
MNATVRSLGELPRVLAELSYLGPMSERPRNYATEPPAGVPQSNTTRAVRTVPIYDARPIASEISLDREGFALLRAKTAVGDLWDDEEIRRVYYREAEGAIAQATGADRVFIFDHTRRKRVRGAEDRMPGLPRQPAARVHVDHTAKSGPQRVRDLLGEEAEELLKGRVQVINLWRPIRGPLRDAPLALCDAASVAPGDLVPADLVYANRVGETYAVTYNPGHRWFYVPAMQRDEALLIKCFDSAEDGRARFVPHTAFDDPSAPADVLPRESIEIRSLVFQRA